MRGRLVDLSHVVEDGMVTYPGLPGPQITDHLSREASRAVFAPGTEFHIGKIQFVANTGTYVDSPFHRYPDGADLSQLRLEQLANLEATVVHAKDRAVTRAAFEGRSIKGRAVLVRTDWDRHWGTEAYANDNPFITRDAAQCLVDAGAALVGIDSLNIDDKNDGTRPAHSLLLRAGIPIVEHLCGLSALPQDGFRFFAVPVRVRAFGTFPVRAFAILEPKPGS